MNPLIVFMIAFSASFCGTWLSDCLWMFYKKRSMLKQAKKNQSSFKEFAQFMEKVIETQEQTQKLKNEPNAKA